MGRTHQLLPTPETVHWGYLDGSLAPVLEVDSGDTVCVETLSGWDEVVDMTRVSARHRHVLEHIRRELGPHLLTGPIHVKGAQPGDTLEVRLEKIELDCDWAWNIIRPLHGTLPADFPATTCRFIELDRARNVAQLPWGPELPLNPFFGIIANAPPVAWGRVSSVQPRAFGGNIDCKEFTQGSSVFLPVFVDGAHLSVGDGHALQGNGEVCLTALETCLRGELRLILHKQTGQAMPRALNDTHLITLGLDEDLDDAARQALREMIDWLVALTGWAPSEAYTFCSLACDLQVSQLVNGVKGIHAMVARERLPADLPVTAIVRSR